MGGIMLNEREQSDVDQSLAMLADTLPPAVYRFYRNSITEGFTDEQALELAKIFLTGLSGKEKD
jgi:hypothetical protein